MGAMPLCPLSHRTNSKALAIAGYSFSVCVGKETEEDARVDVSC
jgi:hypothetical protein